VGARKTAHIMRQLIFMEEPAEAVASFDLGDLGEGTALLRLDRQLALDLFDAFGTEEKTLHANMGGHTGVPPFEGDDGNRLCARHLK
jgi:hypothetical protein